MSWRAWVRGWRASRLTSAGKGSLLVRRVRTPPPVNAGPPRRSTPPATPVALPRRRLCGAIDQLSEAVCSLTATHTGDHSDSRDPETRITWPDDEWTQHRAVAS